MSAKVSRTVLKTSTPGDRRAECNPPSAYPVPFEIDHIIAVKHQGKTVLSNLALACLNDNGHKGPNIAGIDPVTHRLTRLFNPRRHQWHYHFRYDGPVLVGRTAIGRTTVVVLCMNDPVMVALRQELMDQGLFPR
jgi:HNH endonuclease